ncbi:putative cartilage matrix-associated protein [Arapaima gigas]
MSWNPVVSLSLLAALFILAVCRGAEGTAVKDDKVDRKAADLHGSARRIFMRDSDASNFFRRRGRRSVSSQDEIYAEYKQRLAADERRREYNEEQRTEYENYLEEIRDEQNERTRETTEQWREFHYDGLYPRYHQYYK